MKMAKAKPADIDAAGELLSVLSAIDGRFGGPWAIEDADEDLHEFLGSDTFDSDNEQHLKVLYNHLARLLRTAPNFYGRVIGGFCYVIMNEANRIIDPDSDVLDLHPSLTRLPDGGTTLPAKLCTTVHFGQGNNIQVEAHHRVEGEEEVAALTIHPDDQTEVTLTFPTETQASDVLKALVCPPSSIVYSQLIDWIHQTACSPDETFSAADWQSWGKRVLEDVRGLAKADIAAGLATASPGAHAEPATQGGGA